MVRKKRTFFWWFEEIVDVSWFLFKVGLLLGSVAAMIVIGTCYQFAGP